MIIFKLRKNTYNLRNFESLNPRKKQYGLHCIAYRTSQIRETAPIEIRDLIWLKCSNIKNKNIVLQFVSMLLLQVQHLPLRVFLDVIITLYVFSEDLI